ncbi:MULTISPECIES: hypothetical protein [Bacillus]|uniref:Uncharacterized protein n=2 Tax=Bacillus TaxID=1386 RepID=A0A0M4FTZ1_9BACI|nr:MULTISPECIES: hypothetical protein [Bacillus]ALC81743.1 hypothetical protein AM592_09080 [Bacillus gobiensis]MBP1080823.1 hypothetical protein [Bacillus capparidis]MED1097467.1 hypothetical protein [Bacillus capparidis]
MGTLQEELEKYQMANRQKPVKKREVSKKRDENLSERDLRDLMGVDRQILSRKRGGAYRVK